MTRRECRRPPLPLVGLTAAMALVACGGGDRGRGEPFRKVTLNDAPGEPISLTVLPDGRVLHTSRPGTIWLHDPVSGDNSIAAEIDVYDHDEEGLQGIAASPEFETDGWIYLYYSPRLDTPVDDPSTPGTNEGDAFLTSGSSESWVPFQGFTRLSRFQLVGGELSLPSEQVLLEIPSERGSCCHVGGKIDFDSSGRLYLSTGDDTNPFYSDGFTPIDERALRYRALDAQRTAANTNDLRGKLLRLVVDDDGSVRGAEGNLFAPGQEDARDEIYAMGLRNPYRFAVDDESGDVYLADYAPDAPAPDETRGPRALGHWLVIRQPGNFGWPYCRGQQPYVDFDFDTLQSGEPFDCSAPVNDSPNNSGRRELPPVVAPDIAYSYPPSDDFPELGAGGIGPMAGPAYHYDAALDSSIAWPEAYSGLPIFYEWVRDFVAVVRRDADGRAAAVEPLEVEVQNPIDVAFGPDGALYVLEYGDGYFTANPEAQLSRIEYALGG